MTWTYCIEFPAAGTRRAGRAGRGGGETREGGLHRVPSCRLVERAGEMLPHARETLAKCPPLGLVPCRVRVAVRRRIYEVLSLRPTRATAAAAAQGWRGQVLRVLLAWLPICLAAFVRDVGKILEINGLFAFVIAFFAPCVLHLAARRGAMPLRHAASVALQPSVVEAKEPYHRGTCRQLCRWPGPPRDAQSLVCACVHVQRAWHGSARWRGAIHITHGLPHTLGASWLSCYCRWS